MSGDATADPAAEPFELDRPPAFAPGTKVRARTLVRDDGTFPGARVGDVLVEAGDVGWVREVGEFLQRYRIYAVDFVTARRVVGMRAHELECAEGETTGGTGA